MSDQTLPGAVIGDMTESPRPSKSPVDEPPKTAKRATPLSRNVLIVVGLLVIVAAGLWLWMARTPAKSSGAADNKQTAKTIAAKMTTVNGASVEVADLQYQGQSTQAEQALAAQIKVTSDKATKGQLYELEAETYLDQNGYSAALQAAQSAESLAPDANSAQLMAEAEAGLGNKMLAIQDYQTAASRYENNGDLSSMQDMQTAINGLKAQ